MQTISRTQLEALKDSWKNVAYGVSLEIAYWPVIRLHFSLADPRVSVVAQQSTAVVLQPDGPAEPSIAGETLDPEIVLSADEVAAIPGAAEFIAGLHEALRARQPAPPEAITPSDDFPPPPADPIPD